MTEILLLVSPNAKISEKRISTQVTQQFALMFKNNTDIRLGCAGFNVPPTHIIGHFRDGFSERVFLPFYRSKDPTNSINTLKE